MNQVIDKKIDAMNPYNENRHLPSGRVGSLEMLLFSIVALALFVFSAWMLGPLPFILAWPAAAYMVLYSYTKRFTWAANLILGSVLAIGPGGAWIGVTGSISSEMLFLCAAVFLWASAFDILYHIRSRDFYLKDGLHSIPQEFGIKTALNWARTHDVLAVVVFILVGIVTQIAWPYYLGITIVSIILVYKHTILIPYDETKINRTFFRFNAMISIAILSFTFLAVILK
jgi:4-hydroxybenzoate polyprenyltransferase